MLLMASGLARILVSDNSKFHLCLTVNFYSDILTSPQRMLLKVDIPTSNSLHLYSPTHPPLNPSFMSMC